MNTCNNRSVKIAPSRARASSQEIEPGGRTTVQAFRTILLTDSTSQTVHKTSYGSPNRPILGTAKIDIET